MLAPVWIPAVEAVVPMIEVGAMVRGPGTRTGPVAAVTTTATPLLLVCVELESDDDEEVEEGVFQMDGEEEGAEMWRVRAVGPGRRVRPWGVGERERARVGDREVGRGGRGGPGRRARVGSAAVVLWRRAERRAERPVISTRCEATLASVVQEPASRFTRKALRRGEVGGCYTRGSWPQKWPGEVSWREPCCERVKLATPEANISIIWTPKINITIEYMIKFMLYLPGQGRTGSFSESRHRGDGNTWFTLRTSIGWMDVRLISDAIMNNSKKLLFSCRCERL